MSIRDTVSASANPKPKLIENVGEWGAVYVRTLTVGEILDHQADGADAKDPNNRPAIARSFCRMLCEEDGTPVFDAKVPADVATVLALPWLSVREVMNVGNIHNGLAPDPAKAAAGEAGNA